MTDMQWIYALLSFNERNLLKFQNRLLHWIPNSPIVRQYWPFSLTKLEIAKNINIQWKTENVAIFDSGSFEIRNNVLLLYGKENLVIGFFQCFESWILKILPHELNLQIQTNASSDELKSIEILMQHKFCFTKNDKGIFTLEKLYQLDALTT